MRHIFASEVWPPALAFLRRNHHAERTYTGVLARRREVANPTTLDIYAAGPPCQPFSAAGKRLGLCDPLGRGQLFRESVSFIAAARPRTFILENVPQLATTAGGAFFREILATLRSAGYRVSHAVLDAAAHGLPQHRPRLFIVGLRAEETSEDFVFPDPIPAPPLGLLLDPPGHGDSPGGLPSAPTARLIVARARATAEREGGSGDWAIADNLSEEWAGAAPPRQVCPCLIKAMTTGPFLGSRGRHMRLREAARMQGLCIGDWLWPHSPAAFGLLGNSIAQSVAQRILVRIVRHLWGPSIEVHDPWEDGEALAVLMGDAARATPVAQAALFSFGLWPGRPPGPPASHPAAAAGSSADPAAPSS